MQGYFIDKMAPEKFLARGRIIGRDWNKSRRGFPPRYSHLPLLRDLLPPPPPP